MKRCVALAALSLSFSLFAAEVKEFSSAVRVRSLDGRNEIALWTNPLSVAVVRDGVELVPRSDIDLTLDGQSLAALAKTREPQTTMRRVERTSPAPVYKKAVLDESGVFASVDFGAFGVELAARNDGVAYRFRSSKAGETVVDGEKAAFRFDGAATCFYYATPQIGCEEVLSKKSSFSSLNARNVYLPFLVETKGKTVAVLDADVFDYPVLNFSKDREKDALKSVFAPFPKRTYAAGGWDRKTPIDRPGRWLVVAEDEPFLVRTAGTRTFPWRVFALADEPSKLCEADIVNALARAPEEGADFSWVKPGKVAWEWWNDFDHKGVGEGCTTAMYKRFIDFAASNRVEYVIMDEGWSKSLDIWTFNPKVDVPEVIRYGNEKGVGIVLWMAWGQIAGQEAKVAAHFAKLGAKGFKVDFIDRGDALAERFLWAFAAACAKEHMLVDYHGVHRPTGLSRAFPNVVNYEGVHGLEQMKWNRGAYDMTANDVRTAFMRMTAGPLDYTPGAMDNYPLSAYKGDGRNPGSLGTRAHQMALLVVYEAPLQMLCDSPTKYERNAECFAFMAAVPTVWRETLGLGGDPDSMFALARQAKDGAWYAAGIVNGNPQTFDLKTSFLKAGAYEAETFCDAPDSDTSPQRFVHATRRVEAGETLSFPMAPGGGFVVRFTPVPAK